MAGLAATLVPSSLTAQITFQRTCGGISEEVGYSGRQTADGGYIVTGYTETYGAGYYDVFLVKFDSSGDTLWTRTFGGQGWDQGRQVLQTTDGGYIVVGDTRSFGVGAWDVYLIKTDADGDTLWTKTIGGTDLKRGFAIQTTLDGGYVITGSKSTSGAGRDDVYLVKTDAGGDTLWTRTFGGDTEDVGNSVQQTSDGGYIITGFTESFGAGGTDVYLVKTDATGDTMWTRTYGGTGADYGQAGRQTADGGYIVTGSTRTYGSGFYDVYLVKTDAQGDTMWTRRFGGAGMDEGHAVQQTGDSGYIITGRTWSFVTGEYDVYLIKTDADGDTLWARTYGGTSGDLGYSVQQTADGGFVITGSTRSYGAGWSDVYLIKTDSLGNVAVAEPEASPTRTPTLSLTCEPNPFRTRTVISLQLVVDSPAEVAIFDAAGRRVRTFTVNREQRTAWDAKDDFGHPLPSGAYFVRCDIAGEHASGRVILQR